MQEQIPSWMHEKLKSRLRKELEQMRETASVQNIVLETQNHEDELTVLLSFQADSCPCLFHLNLGKGYPLASVTLTCKTINTRLRLADLRDYLPDVLDHPWNFNSSLSQVVGRLKGWCGKMVEADVLTLQSSGKHRLGAFYKNSVISAHWNCKAIQHTSENNLLLRTLLISQAHLLVFRSDLPPLSNPDSFNQDSEQAAKFLVGWCVLQAAKEIVFDRGDLRKLILNFDNQQRVFYFKDYRSFLAKLLKQQWKFNLQQEHHCEIKGLWDGSLINQSELDIKSAMRLSVMYEQELAHHFNKTNLERLNRVYQFIVEFFSARNDPVFLVYVHKINLLCARKDVQVVISLK